MPKIDFSMPQQWPQARKSVRSPDPNYGKLRKSRVTVINKGLVFGLVPLPKVGNLGFFSFDFGRAVPRPLLITVTRDFRNLP